MLPDSMSLLVNRRMQYHRELNERLALFAFSLIGRVSLIRRFPAAPQTLLIYLPLYLPLPQLVISLFYCSQLPAASLKALTPRLPSLFPHSRVCAIFIIFPCAHLPIYIFEIALENAIETIRTARKTIGL